MYANDPFDDAVVTSGISLLQPIFSTMAVMFFHEYLSAATPSSSTFSHSPSSSSSADSTVSSPRSQAAAYAAQRSYSDLSRLRYSIIQDMGLVGGSDDLCGSVNVFAITSTLEESSFTSTFFSSGESSHTSMFFSLEQFFHLDVLLAGRVFHGPEIRVRHDY